jgi:hypothetical protein
VRNLSDTDRRQALVKHHEYDLAIKRSRLVRSLATFRTRVSEASDWRTHLRKNLGRTMLVSLLVGYWFGSITSKKDRA